MGWPAVVKAIISVLGSKALSGGDEGQEAYEMESDYGNIGNTVKPGERRQWNSTEKAYSTVGDVSGVQPGQRRVWNQGTQSYSNAQPTEQSDNSNTIGTIMNLLGNSGGKQKQQPYQMRMIRR